MLFYKVNGFLPDVVEEENEERRLERKRHILKRRTERFNDRQKGKMNISFCGMDGTTLDLVCAVSLTQNVEQAVETFLREVDMKAEALVYTEISYSDYCSKLSQAARMDFVEDDDDVLETMHLVNYFSRHVDFRHADNLIDTKLTKQEIFKNAKKLLCNETLGPELERIYATKDANAMGIPVHYLIEVDDPDSRREIYRTLLAGLCNCGRIKAKRYVYMDIHPYDSVSSGALRDIFFSASDATVVIRYLPQTKEEEDERASGERINIEKICTAVKEFRNQVQTVITIPRECTAVKELFYEYLENILIIELREDTVNTQKAAAYLKNLCKEHAIAYSASLTAKLEKGRSYHPQELSVIFNQWYSEQVLLTYYPQYVNTTATMKKLAKTKVRGNAYEEFEELIGIESAKELLHDALDYAKAQKLFKSKGMVTESRPLALVFTGNPGTAKTTVARLFAKIMRDNGILEKGELFELGRADCVGKYVGHTAPLIQKRFREASQSCLFIDEAYSLVDGHSGSYGDEAINTIVQELTSPRNKDMITIFAGYKDKMEEFLNKNPGLRSRISYIVDFEDYSEEEMLQIARLMAKKLNLRFSKEAEEKMAEDFRQAMKEPNFGNGRYCENFINKAHHKQASRLVHMDYETITEEDVQTILPEDLPERRYKADKKIIGFSA